MVSSQTSGELQFASDTITGLSCTNSAPNTIAAMSTASLARSGAVTGPMNDLSLLVIRERTMCRWRLATGTSVGSQITSPVLWMAGLM